MSALWEIREGHVLDRLGELDDVSVSCCITSPPYWGLRDYGVEPTVWGGDQTHAHCWGGALSVRETTYGGKTRWQHVHNGRGEFQESRSDREGWLRSEVEQGCFCECGAWKGSLGLEPTLDLYVAHVVEIFREVRRVLRDDGTLWLNLGDSYAGSWGAQSRGAADNGTSTIDGAEKRAGSPLSGRQIASHPKGSRIGTIRSADCKPKDLYGVPWAVAFALRADGWYLRRDIIWSKPNPMPESVTDRPTTAHEYVFLLSKGARYYYDAEAIAEAARFEGPNGRQESPYAQGFGRRSADEEHRRREKRRARPGIDDRGGNQGAEGLVWDTRRRSKRSVWTVATQPYPEAHFATFPEALVLPMVLAGCPAGGTVLDPFAGSGTTLKVAVERGRSAVGIELSPEYIALAKRRLVGVTAPLFADEATAR